MSIPKDLSAPMPLAADAELVSKISTQGPIGQCLEEALNEAQALSTKELKDLNDNESSVTTDSNGTNAVESNNDDETEVLPMVDSVMSRRILQSFGEAVACTSWHETEQSSVNRDQSSKCPPAALLRGQLAHYNRFGGQWRIVAEEGSELLYRTVVEQQRQTRKRDRPCLWDISRKRAATKDQRTPFVLDESTQVLAYDDIT